MDGYVTLGPVPSMADCAQVGQDGYCDQAVPDRFAKEPTIRDIVVWASAPGRWEPDAPDRPCMSHFMRCE